MQFEDLVLVVDLANIRPRTYAHRQKYFARLKSKFMKAPPEEMRTSLAYIDECIGNLHAVTPGSVVLKFADYALIDYLPEEDVEEYRRRAGLDNHHEDKIFIVGTAQADIPLLAAVNRVGGCIVSNDNFQARELKIWITPETRIVKFVYSDENNRFIFTAPDGRDLYQWWKEVNSYVTVEWLESREYLDIASRLHLRVREATFEWINVPLTQIPTVPKDIDRVLVKKRVPVITREDEAVRETLFAEELERLHTFVGARVSIVGKLTIVNELTGVTWWHRAQPIVLANPPSFTSKDWDQYVKVTGKLIIRDGALTLQVKSGASYESWNSQQLEDAYLGKPNELISNPTNDAPQGWDFPSFVHSMRTLRRLKRQPGGVGDGVPIETDAATLKADVGDSKGQNDPMIISDPVEPGPESTNGDTAESSPNEAGTLEASGQASLKSEVEQPESAPVDQGQVTVDTDWEEDTDLVSVEPDGPVDGNTINRERGTGPLNKTAVEVLIWSATVIIVFTTFFAWFIG